MKENLIRQIENYPPFNEQEEKQPNGQVLCGQVHDPLARVMNGGISGNAGFLLIE